MQNISDFTDKHKVKRLVSRIIATAREYAYFETPEQVDAFNWGSLPKSYVIKSVTQNGIIIKHEKDTLSIPNAIAIVNTWLKGGGVLIERYIGDNIKKYRLHYSNGLFMFIESNGVANPKPTNLQQIINKGNQLAGLVNNMPFVMIDIYNREMKTCCKTINDLFFGKYDFTNRTYEESTH